MSTKRRLDIPPLPPVPLVLGSFRPDTSHLRWGKAIQTHQDNAHRGQFNASCAGCVELAKKLKRSKEQ
jgi:hypothetical protein